MQNKYEDGFYYLSYAFIVACVISVVIFVRMSVKIETLQQQVKALENKELNYKN